MSSLSLVSVPVCSH